jgi:hypothetical protein
MLLTATIEIVSTWWWVISQILLLLCLSHTCCSEKFSFLLEQWFDGYKCIGWRSHSNLNNILYCFIVFLQFIAYALCNFLINIINQKSKQYVYEENDPDEWIRKRILSNPMGSDSLTESDRIPGHGPIVGSDGKNHFLIHDQISILSHQSARVIR